MEGDEIQVEEVICSGIKVFDVSIPCVELSEWDSLVAADVLDAELAALFPNRVSPFLVVKPPALLGRGVERV